MVWYGSMYSFLKQPVWQVWFTSWSCHWGDWQNNTQLKCGLELKDNGSNNSLFLSCQMGLSDGAFFMIKHTPLPNGNHPISSPVCPMGVADMLEPSIVGIEVEPYNMHSTQCTAMMPKPHTNNECSQRSCQHRTWPCRHCHLRNNSTLC